MTQKHVYYHPGHQHIYH